MILSVKGQHLMKQMFRFYQLREHSVDGMHGIVVMQGGGEEIDTRTVVGGLYCIVLKGWSFLPYALGPFQIYCASLNLGRIFNKPEISDSGPPSLKSLPFAQNFYILKKSVDLSRV
jgi:hypothetical protein